MAVWEDIEIAPVMLINSEEPVYADRAIDTWKEKLRQSFPELDINVVTSQNYTPQLLAQVFSPSLFSEPRLAIVPDLEKASKLAGAEIAAYLEAIPPDCFLILRHNSTGKKLNVNGKKIFTQAAAQGFPIVEIKKVKYPKDKVKAVIAEGTARKRIITNDAAAALVDALGSDLRELLAATDQLLADVSGKITAANVHTYFSGRIEASGFNVADQVVNGNIEEAIRLSRHALATGTAPGQIVAALAVKFRQMAQVIGMQNSHIGVKINLASWQIRQAQNSQRYWKEAALAKAIQEIAQADADVKGQSRDPGYALERAILAIGRARANAK
ncbi:DNA polymerase III subunit delta [uncultured Arcanobacterium sp.]|uniref:DNA polymerase III subunit delta n=1 Tax=uncultured Arcanobacterium sp. TaxID=487520 RepID=UPI0026275DCC|nr:DNA polymerase III subunit delta [uncultured Arcanobacterium sp.]